MLVSILIISIVAKFIWLFRYLFCVVGDSVNDSEATIILDQIDSTRPTAANTSRYEDASIVEPTPSTSAQADQMAELNNDIDGKNIWKLNATG